MEQGSESMYTEGRRFKSFECDLSSERGRREVERGGTRVRRRANWSTRRQPGAIQIDIDTNPRFQQRG